jgi:lysozyme family protein
MANFILICKWCLQIEDRDLTGKVVNLNDGGGRTRFGIAEHYHSNLPLDFYTCATPIAMAVAAQIYKGEYWDKFWGDHLTGEQTASCLLSFSINSGTGRTIRMLQECLDFPDYKIDGVMGPVTLLNSNGFSDRVLSNALRSAQEDYYKACIVSQPTDIRFLTGWLKRARLVYPNLEG